MEEIIGLFIEEPLLTEAVLFCVKGSAVSALPEVIALFGFTLQ